MTLLIRFKQAVTKMDFKKQYERNQWLALNTSTGSNNYLPETCLFYQLNVWRWRSLYKNYPEVQWWIDESVACISGGPGYWKQYFFSL